MILQKAIESSNNIDGWLEFREQVLLYTLAQKVPKDKAIVELGSWMGKSTVMLAAGSLSATRAPVYAVDLFTLPVNDPYDYSQHLVSGTQEYESMFWRNINEYGLASIVKAVKSSTVEAAKAWTGMPIQLLFVDANHSYGEVRDDFLAWVQHCDEGAQIAFHDYVSDKFAGVRRLVDRLVISRILLNPEVVDSTLLGTLAVRRLGFVKVRLALCPAWLSRFVMEIRTIALAPHKVIAYKPILRLILPRPIRRLIGTFVERVNMRTLINKARRTIRLP